LDDSDPDLKALDISLFPEISLFQCKGIKMLTLKNFPTIPNKLGASTKKAIT